MAVATDYVAVVQQLYVSYFGRPADYFGLQNFTAQLAALNAPTDFTALNTAVQTAPTGALAALVNSFNASTESSSLYGTDTSQVGISKFVEAIYENVLGRAPDVEGWAYWTNEITSGRLTRANVAMAITQGALENTSAQGLLDKAAVTNKLAVATNFTAALDTVTEINAYSGDTAAATARGLLAGVDSTTSVTAYQSTVEAAVATVVTGSIPSTNTALTDAVDTVVGGNGNDIFTGVVGTGATLNALDSVDGGAGTDTLNVLAVGAFTTLGGGVSVKNVENITIRGSSDITYDSTTESGVVGVTKLSVTQGANVDVTAAATTAVTVAGATGTIAVDGGLTQTVTATGGNTIDLTGSKGAITVTASAQDSAITIDGGTTVAVTSTAAVAGSDIEIGTTTAPTGAVVVNTTGAAAAGADVTLGDITVTGGTTVSVIAAATSDASFAATDLTKATVVEGAIDINGGAKTTTVTVQQSATVASKDAVDAAAGAYSTDVVTFKALASGKQVTIEGLIFTASKDLTAAEVAAAFANIAAGASQGSGVAGNGIYTGVLTADWTSAAASGATVTFTSKTKVADTLAVSTNGTALATPVHTAGSTSTDAVTGVLGVTAGAVTLSGAALATVSVDGYGTGSAVVSDKLTSLSLANSAEDFAVTNTAATSLSLTLNKITGAAAIDLGSVYTSLDLVTATKDSAIALIADGVKTLTVSGTNAVDLSDAATDLSALVTLKVTGAAGVSVDASGANVTSVDTSGTTGDSTITVDATKATFTGGAGVDTVTLLAAAPTKAVSLGAGDDVLILAATTTSSTANLAGGDGTDTIVFATGADAEDASTDALFEAKISGFEKVGITTFGGADVTVNLDNLDNINYVVVEGATANVLTLDHVANNFTLELTGDTSAATSIDVVLDDATGTSDSINVVLTTDGDTDFGTVNAAGVETIKLTATDTDEDTIDTQTIDLVSTTVKSIVITGNSNVTLANTGDVKLASVDGSAMTGVLTASTNGTLAETIKGGAAADVLTAAGNGDTLIGGAGNDTLIATGNLAKLTGGAGTDTFNVSDATSNVNSYATITDLSVGDIIAFGAGTAFNASKVLLEDTAVFQDYANAAIAESATGDISWFQIGGNTYVIDNVSGGTTFDNGNDLIVKITGNVDLSHASFSATAHTLVLVG
ncbi:S-layer protein [Duganella sp. CF402]|uniref:beta strand repeat-containing protein n=1 Tax=unclassified Duganella TaxID=2636909 RepID=UPI0008B93AEB|nr:MULTISPECIES: DUF4214 domain-containing protein [unclassified Duganella]RZT08691.1 S-layer protein [Duganella sp. BK701]SEL85226.1 S-layer protein [Duganella sp. CF402]